MRIDLLLGSSMKVHPLTFLPHLQILSANFRNKLQVTKNSDISNISYHVLHKLGSIFFAAILFPNYVQMQERKPKGPSPPDQSILLHFILFSMI